MIKIAYSDRFVLDLPKGHRFPMIKYELIKEQLLYQGIISSEQLYDPGLIDRDILLFTHSQNYLNLIENKKITAKDSRKIGFPFTEKLVKRSYSSASGTLKSALYALENRCALNIAGGTHHAFKDHGEAFCLFNDIAVASNYLLNNGLVSKVLVIDLDVHQGNGTASIFQGNERVFTFSVHGRANYPLQKENSDLDIELEPFTRGDEYLNCIHSVLPELIKEVQPDIIFYQAGVDVLESDKLGTLSLSKTDCKNRDRFVFEQCAELDIPVAVSMGGGYSPEVKDIVDAHCNTFVSALDIYH